MSPAATGTPTAAPTDVASETPPSRLRRVIRILGWTTLALGFLILFTVLKLPEERIKNYAQGALVSTLASQGITLTAAKTWISIGFGVSYTLKEVTLSFTSGMASTQPPIQIDQLSVSPALLKLFVGRAGGRLQLNHKEGSLEASFSSPISALLAAGGPASTRPGARGASNMSPLPVTVSFDSKNLDLGQLGVLPAMAGIQGGGILTGSGELDGDLNVPTTLTGQLQLELKKIRINQQAIMGFGIPELNISEGKADITFDKGKTQLKSVNLGKAASASDDLVANVTGDMVLGNTWDSSKANLKLNFRLSQNVLKSLSLIDALLGPGKQADGSYSYTLTGPLAGMSFAPVPAAGGTGR